MSLYSTEQHTKFVFVDTPDVSRDNANPGGGDAILRHLAIEENGSRNNNNCTLHKAVLDEIAVGSIRH